MFRPTGLLMFRRLLRLLYWVRRSEFLVFLPAITLAGFWLGGESVLLLLALGLPLLFALTAAPLAPLLTDRPIAPCTGHELDQRVKGAGLGFRRGGRAVHSIHALLHKELRLGFERGEIRAHFQPQISIDTREITGVEALARWHHPSRGCLVPADFLPAVESCGLTQKLGEVMLREALTALTDWDRRGRRVPRIAVNFSGSELRDPRLPDQLRWELDRYDLTPDRLTVEILETVVAASADDAVVANVAALAAMGCGIDLDDFGTGHASITAIRRFSVRRLKIDRSLISNLDQDREQQKMVSAILSLAERLGLETLAEGVETAAEQAMVAQLGCGHIQGYVLARPMPFDDVTIWMLRYRGLTEIMPRMGAGGG